MFACMVEIDDLDSAGKVLIGQVPDPVRAIAHHNPNGGTVPTPLVSLGIDAKTKLPGSFNGTDIGGGSFIAHRSALGIDPGLGEYRTQFAFPCASRLTRVSTWPPFGVGLHHKHLRAINLNIQVGNS